MEGFTKVQERAYKSASNQIMNATEEELDDIIQEDNPDVSFETMEEKQNHLLEAEHACISLATDDNLLAIYL